MRKGLTLVAGVLVLLIGAVVLAIANLDAFVDANRTAVEERVEQALGRPVSFGEVGISWAGGFGVRVADLRVGEDAALAKDRPDLLTAKVVDVRVNLLAALFGRIEVTRVILRSPRITVIQTANGLSTDGLAGGASSDGPAGAPTELGAKKEAPREFQISLVDVRDGELTFIDRTAEPPATFEVKALDVSIPSYRPSEPVEFEISAAVAGAKSPNLVLSGTAGPLGAGSVRLDLSLGLDPLEIGDLVRLSFAPAALAGSGAVSVQAQAQGTLDALAYTANIDARKAALRYGGAFDKPAGVALDLGLRGSRKDGALVVDKAELVVGETAVRVTGSVTDFDAPRLAFTAKADSVAPEAFGAGDSGDRLRDLDVKGQFRFPESGVNGTLALTSPEGVYTGAPYRNLRVEAGVAGGRITVDRFSVDASQGELVARGHYDLERSAFDGSAELAQMRIEELVATRSKPAADLLSGALSGDLSVNGAGSNWKEIERALAGTGELRIEDGTLGKFNPARQLFTALGGLPSLRGGGLVQFVNSHPRLFGTEEAPFQAMSGRLRIRDGWLLLRNFALRTADYDLQGEGRVSLGGVVDVKTQMVLSPALSQELVAAAPPLRYLRQPSGRIEIPVALRGEMSQVAVVPDVSSIAASAGRELLVDALSGALGGKTREDAPSGQPAPAKPEDVGRELLRQGLEGLFGGGKR
jgi:uncharacterized protein involved in outer membrane biogenesis